MVHGAVLPLVPEMDALVQHVVGDLHADPDDGADPRAEGDGDGDGYDDRGQTDCAAVDRLVIPMSKTKRRR